MSCIPIKCFTCGKVLADKYGWYLAQVRQKKLSHGTDVEEIIYLTPKTKTDVKAIEGQVLDELGLTNACCRTRMLTHVDIE